MVYTRVGNLRHAYGGCATSQDLMRWHLRPRDQSYLQSQPRPRPNNGIHLQAAGL